MRLTTNTHVPDGHSKPAATADLAETIDLTFVDAAPSPIMITDPDPSAPGPRIRRVNRAFERLTGWPREEIVGRTPRVLQGPETDPAVLRDLKAALVAGETWSGETINYTYDGTPYVLSWSIAPVHDAAGRLVAYMSMQNDVTVEHERERERRRLNQLVARFVDAAPDGVVITDGDQNIVQVNAGAQTIFSHDREAMVGQPLEKLFPPRDRADHHMDIAAFARSPRRSQWMGGNGEVSGLRRDGTHFPMRASLVKVDDTGAEGFAVFVRDLTPWKAQQEELRESDRCLRQAQRIAGLGHWYWHVRSGTVSWSEELYRLLGYAPNATQPTYAALVDHVHADDRERVRRALNDATAGTRGFDMEHRIIRADGATRVVRAQAEIDRTADGSPRAVLGVVHDVTEMHEAKSALESAYREVEIANSAKSRFLAMLSHELRTPLNAINGFADLIADEQHGPLGAPEYAGYLRHIQESGRHLSNLIESMLDATYVESKRLALTETQTSAPGVLRAAVDQARAETTRPDVAIAVTEGPDVDLIADAQRVRQAVRNLVHNAVKFSPAQGTVRVAGARTADGGYRIDVMDDGPGIQPDHARNLTLPFVQGDDTHTRNHDGVGIGLYLAHSFFELHDGSLSLDTASTGGAIATAWLPPTRVAAAGAPPESATPGTGDHKTAVIGPRATSR